MKALLALAALSLCSSLFAESPRVTVVQTTATACNYWNLLFPGSCRPSVVIKVSSNTAGDKFVIGLRYRDAAGDEVLESRYPVKGDTFWFYLDEIQPLSATAGSFTTGEVGVWFAPAN